MYLSIGRLILIGLIVSIVGGATISTLAAQPPLPNADTTITQSGMMYGSGRFGSMPTGMQNTTAQPSNGMPSGMPGRNHGGMMQSTPPAQSGGQSLTQAQVEGAVTTYLSRMGNTHLAIDEIMFFTNNAYVAVKDTATGGGAFELLVDPVSKTAFPEYGPNMMWNVLYSPMVGQSSGTATARGNMGMMGGSTGMMGNYSGGMMSGPAIAPAQPYQYGHMPVTAAQALQKAQTFLDGAYPGVTTTQTADEFPGYYTIDVQQQSTITGMLSVNGYTGQVWYHTWHGQFLSLIEYSK